MALVVLLRGVNVGGHRTFRPSALATQLRHLDAVNIGAAGTFVVRKRIGQAQLRAEFARRLPFETTIVICQGGDIVKLAARDPFARYAARPDIIPFVSVLSRSPRATPVTPLRLPAKGTWMVKVLTRENRFVVGMYRRHMKVLSYLGKMDDVFGAPATTRNWNTLAAIARVVTGV